MMKGVEVGVTNVTNVLRGLVEQYPDYVFVGQSLVCDLRIVRMTQPYVIDTSVLFNLSGVEGKKTSLRDLASSLLDEEIRVERRNGEGGKKHCPVEDATAAMKLVKKKFGEGECLGVWDANYAYLGAQNYGIAGDKTENVLWQIQNGELDSLHPKLVVHYIGSNKVPAVPNNDDVVRGVNTVVTKLPEKLQNASILLVGSFPRWDQREKTVTLGMIRAINDKL